MCCSYITEISEQIKIRSAEAGEEGDEDSQFVRFFPSFVWVVRDFTLSLEIDGNEVTEDEYLDFALQLKKGILNKMPNLGSCCFLGRIKFYFLKKFK